VSQTRTQFQSFPNDPQTSPNPPLKSQNASQNGGARAAACKRHTNTYQRSTKHKKKTNSNILIATPDEILQEGLEIGGFNRQQQQRVKHNTNLR
jgi:hypothetical protein